MRDSFRPTSTEFQDRITETNARDSQLLRLPAELRNRIYNYVFDAVRFKVYKTTEFDTYYLAQHACPITRYKAKARFGIPSVCRQLYAETTILSRRSVIYDFIHPTKLTAWTKTLPPHIRAHVNEISLPANYGWCSARRGGFTFYCSEKFVRGLDELAEACGLLQGLECVELTIWSRLHFWKTDSTAIEKLKAKLTKGDGRKVEVVLRYIDL